MLSIKITFKLVFTVEKSSQTYLKSKTPPLTSHNPCHEFMGAKAWKGQQGLVYLRSKRYNKVLSGLKASAPIGLYICI